ncbi:MAG: cobalamin B12-binding domain-containing protein [Elusimicrobia bacterium]|nr:cobalamin B12-binding domain-containing protein [Elusimicrobiota bacterium]
MSRVLLVNPPDDLDAFLGAGKAYVQRYEPLGLLYVAASARRAGHEVAVIDCPGEGIGLDELEGRIRAMRPEVVGVSTLTSGGGSVYALGRWLKAELPGTLVVLGNVHASVYAKEYLANGCCDAVVHGEGERAFEMILERRARGGGQGCALADCPGVSFKDAGGTVRPASPAGVVEDLALLPLPARDLVGSNAYGLSSVSNQLYIPAKGAVVKTLSTSRGCAFACTFCVVNCRQRFRPAKAVVDEMELLEKEHGASYLAIVDPACMADRGRMLDICSEIGRRGLRARWGCDSRVNFVDPELVKAMDRANCFDLSFGIESGVQRLLNNVKKGETLEQARKAVAVVKEHSGIQLAGLFILGLPGETRRDSLETIRFALELPLDMAQFSILSPYPGSALFEELRAKGEIDDGVRPDGSLDPSVWARYSAYISFTENDPAWVTPGLTAGELKSLQKKALRDFYLRPSHILRQLRRVHPGNLLQVARLAAATFF